MRQLADRRLTVTHLLFDEEADMDKKKVTAILTAFLLVASVCLLSFRELKTVVPDDPIGSHSEEIDVDKMKQLDMESLSSLKHGSGLDKEKKGDKKAQDEKKDESDEKGEEQEKEESKDPDDSDEDSDKDDGDIDGPEESDDASDKEGDGDTAEESPDPGKPTTHDPKIITDLKNQFFTTKQLKKDKYKFYAYIADNDGETTLSVKFRNNETSIQGKYLTPKRGRDYTAVLSKKGNGYNFITLYMKKNGEVIKQITYTIRYTEDKADDDDPEKGEHPPVIKTNLDNRTKPVKTRNFIFTVSAKTYKKKYLPYDHIKVSFDGKTLKTTPTGAGTYEYDLYFNPPDHGDTETHKVKVLAWDDEGNSKQIERKVVYEFANEGDVIGKATVNVDATVIGLGVIASGAKCDIKQDEPASVVIVEALEEYGFTAEYTGTPKSGFYLKGISGGYIANGARIPANLKEKLEDDGLNMTGQKSKNRINEFDYTEGSGWLYTIDGHLHPGRGMSGYYLEDGDVVTLRFTLAYGKDLGGTSTRGLLSSYCGKWMNGSYTAHHNMGDPEVVKEPTCEEDGLKETRCKVKGCRECKEETIPKLGHDFKEVSREEPTYDKEGKIVYKCKRCDKTKTETIPKKPKPDDPDDPDDPPDDPDDPPDNPDNPGGGDDGGDDGGDGGEGGGGSKASTAGSRLTLYPGTLNSLRFVRKVA